MVDIDAAPHAERDRPLRRDAEQRRRALLCAAASVFLRDGLDAPLESVAREAAVGIATLYRRFPTREALVEAVFEAKMSAYADRAEAALAQSIAEPWPAFAGYVRDITAMQTSDPAFGAVLLRPMQGSELFAAEHARSLRSTRLLVSRLRKTGVVRQDLRETDLYLLATATAALAASPGPVPREDAASRMTELFLDAIRTTVTDSVDPRGTMKGSDE